MSAAAVATIPRALSRGFCRTPHQFFCKLPALVSKTEFVCMGLILDSTVGWQRDRAVITIQQFMQVANVSRRAVEMALDTLQKPASDGGKGMIRCTTTIQGFREYSLAPEWLPDQEPGRVAKAWCPHCRTVGEVEIEPAGITQVPHAYFLKLPRAATYSELAVVGYILDATVGWTKPDAAITNEELQAATGLSFRAVQEATASAEENGWIAIQLQAGAANHFGSLYQCLTHNFGAASARLARRVNRDKSVQKEKAQLPKQLEVVDTATTPHAVECQGVKAYARCRNCREVGLVVLVSTAQNQPQPSGRPKSREPARVYVPDGLEEYLWRWADVIGCPVTPDALDRIAAAMYPATLADFADRCEQRRQYLSRHGQSLRVLEGVARDVARLAERASLQRKKQQPARPPEENRDWMAEFDLEMAAWWLERYEKLGNDSGVSAADRERLLVRFPELRR